MMTNTIIMSILAIWITLVSSTYKLSCDARSTPIINGQKRRILSSSNSINAPYDQNHPPTPLCVYPPPTFPPRPPATTPPPHSDRDHAVWCVAKSTMTSSLMQQALDYACGSGADCQPIQPGGACYQPATLLAHAAYAFNSYWQKNKKGGGACDFGGLAMLVTVDPSYDQCHYPYS